MQEQIRQDRAYHPTCRGSCRTRHDATILHLYTSLQPALEVEKHPRAVRMFADRREQQLPINAVEIALDVDIEHPVVPPATLTSLPEGIDRRPAGSVSVESAWKIGSSRGSRYRLTTSWAILSPTVGIPNGRVRPSSFGMSTRRTGGGN